MRRITRLRRLGRTRRWLAWMGVVCTTLILGPGDAVAARKVKSLCQPVDVCTDPRGCPDFVVDQGTLLSTDRYFTALVVHRYSETDCSVIEGEVLAGRRELVTFATNISNFGPGAITLGNPLDHPEWFDLVTCHGHAHIKEYADFRLWTVDGYQQWMAERAAAPDACVLDIFAAHPELESQLVRGAKRGFCLYDVFPHELGSTVPCPALAHDPQTYFDCNFSGLSVCWSDQYNYIPGFIDGQSIDVVDVPDGEYVLENEVNARHFFTEADYSNNSAAIKIRLFHKGLGRRELEVLGAP